MPNIAMSTSHDPNAYKNPGFWCKTTFIQLAYGAWISLTAIGVGLAFGFPAVMVPQLFLPDSEIHPSLVDESWIVSVISLSAPFGCLITGLLMDRCGRSKVLFLSEGPMSVGWLYTGFSTTARDIVIGRLIIGLGCGMALSGPNIYLTEIALPNVRGFMGSIPGLGVACGVTMQAFLGALFHWTALCYICGVYSMILLMSNYFLPETPYFTLLRDTEEHSRKMLRKFRSNKHDIEAEMADLLKFKQNYQIDKLNWREVLHTIVKPYAYRPFGIIISYFAFTHFSGTYVLIMWSVVMLQNSKSSVDPNIGNEYLGITRVLFGILVAFLLLRLRRRTMALTSAGGVAVVCITIGLYIHLTPEPTFLPQVLFMMLIALTVMGYATLPILFMCETYPLQIRGVLVGISVSMYNFFIFVSNFIFSYECKYLGFANTMILYGCTSFVGFVFLYIYILETKEFTLQQIEVYFRQEHPVLPFRMKPGMVVVTADRANPEANKANDLVLKNITTRPNK